MKRNIVFSIIISLLLVTILSQTTIATQYSDKNESAMQINLFNPKYNFTYDNVTRLVFNFESTGTCDAYTNYTGTWKKVGEKFWILDDSGTAQVIDVSFTNEGFYRWNVLCYNTTGGDSTWAEYDHRIFHIVPPAEDPSETNQTQTNESTNTTKPSETNQTQTNESTNTTTTSLLNCSGCENEGICYEFEAKIIINNKQVTCNSEGIFIRPMENSESCSDNNDCRSNYCLNNFCRTNWILTTILATFGFY